DSRVKVACAEDYGVATDLIWTPVSAVGDTFSGPVTAVARPGGRFAVTAVHAPDGEVWTWEFPHSLGAQTVTVSVPIRSFRYTKTPVVAGTLPTGEPVGFTTDVQGRFWAINLNVTGPEQPTWKALDIPAAGVTPVGELTAVTTASGIRLAGLTAAGNVVTGLYAGPGTALNWTSLGASGATGKVAMGVSRSGLTQWVVRHTDNTVWSLTGSGWWVQVNTTYNGSALPITGSPSSVYDPQTGLNGVFVRTALGTGYLYAIWESLPDSGNFTTSTVQPITEVGTFGIKSDVTAWDFRNEDIASTGRRWGIAYFDDASTERAWLKPTSP
ncbi:MAG: hypothetical protein ACJ716_11880, partial [Marmoricola sp.]